MQVSIKKDGDYLRTYLHDMLALDISLKNIKLRAGIAIVNFGPAFFCTGEAFGYCSVCLECYAKGREVVPSAWHPGHQDVLDYRWRQYEFFKHATEQEILLVFEHVCLWLVSHGYRRIRFSESSDFYTQWYVAIAEKIARIARQYGIVCYTYTTRRDLNYDDVDTLIINGSGWAGPHGETCVIEKGAPLPAGFKLCKEDCGVCWMCARKGCKVAFVKHGTYRDPWRPGPYIRTTPGWQVQHG